MCQIRVYPSQYSFEKNALNDIKRRLKLASGRHLQLNAHSCPVPGALEWEGGVRPAINEARCTGCAMCREACIVDPKAAAVSALVPDEEDQAAARTQNSMI